MSKQTLMMIVYKRLKAEGRWEEAEPVRNELASLARDNGLKGIDAQCYTYTELARRFPPKDGKPAEVQADEKPDEQPKRQKTNKRDDGEGDAVRFDSSVDVEKSARKPSVDSEFSVSGLSEIPANWPDLPSNASLAAEVSWVQANRLRVVRESSDRVVVDLSKALSPAPSWATLGWLETSIKTYSAFVNVAAKATSGQDNEASEVRREQQSIEEVRKILASMLEG